MNGPFSPLQLLLLLTLLAFLMTAIQLGALTIAFDKLGLSPSSAAMLLLTSLFGSLINLPLFKMRAEPPPGGVIPPRRGLLRLPQLPFTGTTLVAVNVGGGLVPTTFSVYLLRNNPLAASDVILSIAVVAGVAYLASRPLPGLGIGMPVFVAPATAAMTAILIDGGQSAPLAYIGGTLGVLLGADLLRLPDIRRMGTPIASIGGAGTFDGIFLTGLIAVLLA